MPTTVTRNLTILLTDIEDFTPKTSRKTRADILRMLEEHKRLVLPLLEGRGGRLIKTIGDAFLVVYESPTDAVLAGVEVQRVLRLHNADK
jgi:class 3 adenylate cyclase